MSKSSASNTELFAHQRNAGVPSRFALMSSDRVIVDAIKMAQRLLWQNLPPTHSMPDATTVMRFRDLVRSPAVRSALERSSDTFPAFTLRAAERVLGDQSRADREIIDRLWSLKITNPESMGTRRLVNARLQKNGNRNRAT
jgi:hypothetical protein